MTDLLLRHYKVDDSSDLHKLLSTMPSVAGRSFLVKQWVGTPRELQTYSEVGQHVSLKYEQEFQADMLPLLEDMQSLGKKRDLLQLRKLAQGTATEDPNSWFPSTIYHHFFRHYIDKSCSDDGKTKHSFADTPFATLVMQHIGVKGDLLIPTSMSLLKYRHNFTGVNTLTQSMGEHVKGAIASNNEAMVGDSRKIWLFERVEEVTANHCKKYGFDIDSIMPTLLDHKNHSIKNHLPGEQWDASAMAKPYCAFLYAMRNAWSHPEGRPDELTNQIIFDFCPNEWADLVSLYEAIKKESYKL